MCRQLSAGPLPHTMTLPLLSVTLARTQRTNVWIIANQVGTQREAISLDTIKALSNDNYEQDSEEEVMAIDDDPSSSDDDADEQELARFKANNRVRDRSGDSDDDDKALSDNSEGWGGERNEYYASDDVSEGDDGILLTLT